jgi:RNA polymerase sigma factor for flagellar operon FliA
MMSRLGQYEKAKAPSRLTKADKEELVKKYASLVKLTAFRLMARLPKEDFLDDLISCGNIGLLEALESFNPQLNIRFESFAKFRIRGAMLDELRHRDWIPRSVRSTLRKIDNVHRKLASELDHLPDDKEMAAALEVSLEEYYDMMTYLQPAGFVSYEDLSGSRFDDRSVLDFLEDRKSAHPDFELQIKQLKNQIIGALEVLTQEEQMVMALYYYEGLTFNEIGEILKVSESRVSQIHGKTLLRLNLRLKVLKDQIQDLEDDQEGEG